MLARRLGGGGLRPEHRADDHVERRRFARQVGGVLVVAQNRDVVADLEDLGHVVGDEDEDDALRGQRADHVEADAHFGLVQRRGRPG